MSGVIASTCVQPTELRIISKVTGNTFDVTILGPSSYGRDFARLYLLELPTSLQRSYHEVYYGDGGVIIPTGPLRGRYVSVDDFVDASLNIQPPVDWEKKDLIETIIFVDDIASEEPFDANGNPAPPIYIRPPRPADPVNEFIVTEECYHVHSSGDCPHGCFVRGPSCSPLTAKQAGPRPSTPPRVVSQPLPASASRYGVPREVIDGMPMDSRCPSPDPDGPSEQTDLKRIPSFEYLETLLHDTRNSTASHRLLQIMKDENISPASSLGLKLLDLVEELQLGDHLDQEPRTVKDRATQASQVTQDAQPRSGYGQIEERLNDFADMLNHIAAAVGVNVVEEDDRESTEEDEIEHKLAQLQVSADGSSEDPRPVSPSLGTMPTLTSQHPQSAESSTAEVEPTSQSLLSGLLTNDSRVDERSHLPAQSCTDSSSSTSEISHTEEAGATMTSPLSGQGNHMQGSLASVVSHVSGDAVRCPTSHSGNPDDMFSNELLNYDDHGGIEASFGGLSVLNGRDRGPIEPPLIGGVRKYLDHRRSLAMWSRALSYDSCSESEGDAHDSPVSPTCDTVQEEPGITPTEPPSPRVESAVEDRPEERSSEANGIPLNETAGDAPTLAEASSEFAPPANPPATSSITSSPFSAREPPQSLPTTEPAGDYIGGDSIEHWRNGATRFSAPDFHPNVPLLPPARRSHDSCAIRAIPNGHSVGPPCIEYPDFMCIKPRSSRWPATWGEAFLFSGRRPYLNLGPRPPSPNAVSVAAHSEDIQQEAHLRESEAARIESARRCSFYHRVNNNPFVNATSQRMLPPGLQHPPQQAFNGSAGYVAYPNFQSLPHVSVNANGNLHPGAYPPAHMPYPAHFPENLARTYGRSTQGSPAWTPLASMPPYPYMR